MSRSLITKCKKRSEDFTVVPLDFGLPSIKITLTEIGGKTQK